MPKNVPNASSRYSQLPTTWYNPKQSLKPNISKYMLKNDEKRKLRFCFNSALQKFCHFISHLTRLLPPTPSTTLVQSPTSLVVP